jgi:hypothetical protein
VEVGFFGGGIALEVAVPVMDDRDADAAKEGRDLEGLVTELALGRDDIDGRDEASDVRGVAVVPV